MTISDKIKIMLVDDHTLVRDALASMLHQIADIQVVGSVASGEDLLGKLKSINPDVVLMDIMLKGMSGIEATRWVKERAGHVKVILVSSEIKKEFVSAGIQSGIDGYLPKDVEKTTLLNAIHSVMKGEKYFNEAVTTLIFEDFYKKEMNIVHGERQLNITDLTKRELEVLTLIANGKTNKEVADELFISSKTVDSHKMHILDKLGLKNTAELVKYAIKHNLITV
jgi:DNA-binding NarL/FixJ family response regulator